MSSLEVQNRDLFVFFFFDILVYPRPQIDIEMSLQTYQDYYQDYSSNWTNQQYPIYELIVGRDQEIYMRDINNYLQNHSKVISW